MSTGQTAFDDVLDPKTGSKSKRGPDAARKAMLSNCEAPVDTLAALGVEVPHTDFDPEHSHDYPTTVHFWDGPEGWTAYDGDAPFDFEAVGATMSVHLHQDVREEMDTAFGDFGSIDEDSEDDIIWTVVDLLDGTVTLTVVGDWGKRRDVPFEEFPENYEPLHLTDGEPRWGY